MIQNIRDNSQGWIAKTIIAVIVALLALTGFEAIFNSMGGGNLAAKVNGEDISQDDLNQAMNMQRRQLMQQLGSNFDASMFNDELLRESALNSLIDRILLLQGAKDAGFSFSQAGLDRLILQTPEFQIDGAFSAPRFDQVIQQMGYTRLQFRQLLEQEMLIGQLRAGITGTGFVTDQQIDNFARLEMQTRDFATIAIPADSKSIEVGEEEVAQYYESHGDQFRSPEQVVVEYLELKKDSFFDQVDVSDEDLQDLYQKQIANLAEQRRAAHILIEVGGKDDDAKAKAQIQAIGERLQKGEDFAALAKEFSQDPGSAKEGGDLGFAGPGVYDPAFETALYGLKQNEVSAPVRTEFGWHLIKLLGVQAPEVPSFASLKPQLERELKTQQVEQRFVEVSKQLEDSAFEASDLAQPAQELGLKVQTTAPFGREGGEGIAANRQVIQAAFSDEVLVDGANSGVIELDPDTIVAVRVKEHMDSKALKLDEVKESIVQHLQQEKAADKARTQGERLISELRAGDDPQADQWQLSEAATRNQDGVDPVVLQAVFRMPKPEGKQPTYAGIPLADGSFVVLRLRGVNEAAGTLSAEDRENYRNFLASRAGQQDFAAYREKLQAEAKIKRL